MHNSPGRKQYEMQSQQTVETTLAGSGKSGLFVSLFGSYIVDILTFGLLETEKIIQCAEGQNNQ